MLLPHEILGDVQHRMLVRAPDVVDVTLHPGVEDLLERSRYVGDVEKIPSVFSWNGADVMLAVQRRPTREQDKRGPKRRGNTELQHDKTNKQTKLIS